jgi:O-antigen ligase
MFGEFFAAHSQLGCWRMRILERRPGVELARSLFLFSSLLFRLGLATMTFEEVRPFDVLLSDYFFFSSLFLLLCSSNRRLLKSRGSGVLAASAILLLGVLLSGVTSKAAPRLIILFGLFAPLAVAHARNIYKNIYAIVTGATINCVIALMSLVVPGIVTVLTISPRASSLAEEMGRATGLTGHPNSLGVSAALGVLLAVGLLGYENSPLRRLVLLAAIPICTLAAIFSGSRAFFVTLVPALFILTLWRKWDRKLLLRFCFGLAGLFVAWVSINYFFVNATASYAERLSKTDANDYENSVRLSMVTVALVEISQKPIAGWGLERFGEAGMVYVPDNRDFLPVHVNLLNYWYAEGILGAIGYALLFILPVKGMLQTLKKECSDNLARVLRLGVCVYLVLFIVSNLDPLLLNRFFYMPLFLFAGLAANVPDPLRARFSKKPSHKQLPSQGLLGPAQTLGPENSPDSI